MEKPVRIGLVGAGMVAARHAGILAEFPDVRVTAFADPDLERARALADRYGADAYPSHEAMLEAADLEAAYVCVPPFAHGAPELTLIEAGLPLFVEKPLALDQATAERISAAAKARGVVTAVGHHWRYLDVLDRARALLADRPIRLALGHWLDKVPPVPWWVRRAQSGGQVVEQAVHVLDLARVLVGEVVEVHTVESGCVPPGCQDADVDAATVASLRFAEGAVGALVATCLLSWKHRAGLEVYAEGVALEVTETALTVHSPEGDRATDDPGEAKRRIDRAFVDAVRGVGSDVRVPYPEALKTHRLACAVAHSATEQRSIRLDQPDGSTEQDGSGAANGGVVAGGSVSGNGGGGADG